MKRSSKVLVKKAAHRLCIFTMMIGMFIGMIDFVDRCNIESDSMYFAMVGMMFIMVIMMTFFYWLAFGEAIDNTYLKQYMYYIKREHEMRIKRELRQQEKETNTKTEVHNHWKIETDENGNIVNIYRNKK